MGIPQPWSSYRATAGEQSKPSWLNTDWLLAGFAQKKLIAVERYKQFVQSMQSLVEMDKELSEIPLSQRRPAPKPLSYYAEKYKTRNDAIVHAYTSGGYTLKEIGECFKLHYSTVSGIITNHKSKT